MLTSLVPALPFLAVLARSVAAQATFVISNTTCYVDPSDSHDLAAPVYFSDSDLTDGENEGGNIEIWYNDSTNTTHSVYADNYIGYDDDNAAATPTGYVDLALTSIPNGGIVTQYFEYSTYGGEDYTTNTAYYTLYQSPTVVFTSTSTTVTDTIVGSSTSTETIAAGTTTSTSTVNPVVTAKNVTGTSTHTLPTSTKTITSLITPAPAVEIIWGWTYITKTSTCIAGKSSSTSSSSSSSKVASKLKKKRGNMEISTSNYETPSCGAYNPSTVTTSTVVYSTNTTVTPTETVNSTSTVHHTVTGAKTTVYKFVNATVTVTPSPATTSTTSTLKQKTSTERKLVTIYETLLPSGKRTPLCKTAEQEKVAKKIARR